MRSRIRVTPRGVSGPSVRFGVPFAALIVALLLGAIILTIAGNDPIEAYRAMFDTSLSDWKAITRTLALATPLILTGLAAAVGRCNAAWGRGVREGRREAGRPAAAGSLPFRRGRRCRGP